jgi:Lon protease-like protein
VQLGLFLLEGVLLPTEQVPLHVFEPRYQELIGECLEHETDFGWLLADEEGGMRDVGCRAKVIGVLERFDDGRLLVAVEGGEPFRVDRLTQGRSFYTAEVEPVADDGSVRAAADAKRALELYRSILELTDAETELPDAASPILSYELAARIEFAADEKQELLELRSERERLGRVVELLDETATQLSREKEARDRASGNGRVSPR